MATVYKYQDYEYRDEAGEFTTEEVRKQLTQYFPELAQATAETKKVGDDTVVTFVKRAGTKGNDEQTYGMALTHFDSLGELVSVPDFIRVSQSYWINISKVKLIVGSLADDSCVLVDDAILCGDEAKNLLTWLEENSLDIRREKECDDAGRFGQ
ncbi:MAG: hypothetical protein JXR84_04300 [Anaerolineae bacterium]|nr:hypothetical protein [Anaerolineae bacterium]